MIFRWAALAVLMACVSISAYYRRRARLEGGTIPRSREGGLMMLGRAVVALPLFLGVLSYIIDPRSMAWASLDLPAWARWAGVALGFLAIPLIFWVFRSLGKNVSETVLTKDHHALVTRGPYRWVRHPLYATALTMFFAIGFMAANWFILLVALIALILIRLVVVPLEERELLRKFGGAYAEYMRQTGRLLPRLAARGNPAVRSTR